MIDCTRKPLTAQAVEQAMKEHDGLVHAFIQRQGGGDISYEEALQAGRIGLWHALQGYDPARGTAFSTYAWVAIYRRIHRRAKELSPDTEVLSAEIAGSWVLPDPARELEKKLIQDVLHELVGQLPKRLCQVVVGRFGLGAQPPCTLKELGQELGLSGERVRQLEQDALAWLRHPAHSWYLRHLTGKNTAVDYRRALAQNAALRRARRKRR
ncbi:MAG: sigma-70 family RNA polymerase sigma factor [Anaerolineales bacterium]|nr:MAG: sigma-70 family RNA polymerase sigma factor [Anaerolineales bacterium]